MLDNCLVRLGSRRDGSSIDTSDLISVIPSPSRHRLHLRQQIPELAVIHFHPVVQIEADAHVGVVAELLVVGQQFDVFLLQRLDLLGDLVAGGGGAGGVLVFFQHFDTRLHFAGERDDVFGSVPSW